MMDSDLMGYQLESGYVCPSYIEYKVCLFARKSADLDSEAEAEAESESGERTRSLAY